MSIENKFSSFKSKMKSFRAPNSSDGTYSRYGFLRSRPVRPSYDINDITNLIISGNIDELRELSKYYYRTSGIYRNSIELRANLSLYDTIVIPVYNINKPVSKDKTINNFNKACHFIDSLNIPLNFSRISREIFITGSYNGILRQEEDSFIIQDLPLAYCRSRYKDYNGLDILEFNVNYFNSISNEEDKKLALNSFPIEVKKAYRDYTKGLLSNPWIEIPAETGGISFSYGDKTPILIASIPSIYKLDEAVERESRRDEDELAKLLIQQMPIDSKGELVFTLDEVAEIHESIAEMLKDRDTIDVLTTFGETSLESVQDSTSASQSSDRITKYKDNSYDQLGIASLLFNPDGSTSLSYAVKKEEAIITNLNNIYANWLRYQINKRFASPNVKFDFAILPTTIFNKKEIQDQFFRGAQYGYSKMYGGVAMGIKQSNQLSLMSFENDFLNMSEKMIPLQSSYTTSGNSFKNGVNSSTDQDTNNSGGRPEKSIEEKSEQTVRDIEGR